MLQQALNLVRSAIPYVEMVAFFSPTFDLLWDRFLALQILLAEQREHDGASQRDEQEADLPKGSEQLQRIQRRERGAAAPAGLIGFLFRYRYFLLCAAITHMLGARHVWDVAFAQSKLGGVFVVIVLALTIALTAFLATPPISGFALAWIMNRIVGVGPHDRNPLGLPAVFWPSGSGITAANVILAASHGSLTLSVAYLVGRGAFTADLAWVIAFFVSPFVLGFLVAWQFKIRPYWLIPSLLLGFAVWFWYSLIVQDKAGPQGWLFLRPNAVALVLLALLGSWLGWAAHCRSQTRTE